LRFLSQASSLQKQLEFVKVSRCESFRELSLK